MTKTIFEDLAVNVIPNGEREELVMSARGGIAASVKSWNGQEGREAGVHGIQNISSITIRKGSKASELNST